jgi:beta-galactosidase GanA
MDRKYIYDLRSSGKYLNKPGVFFRGNFFIENKGDTFIDVSNYTKGIVWVNGHNLGRYWDIGPQKRLYCPASWLMQGFNEIIIFDLHLTEPKPAFGMLTLE